LLSARLATMLWIISLLATIFLMVKEYSIANFAEQLPFVNLLVCFVAM
jgi:hypothetical protein